MNKKERDWIFSFCRIAQEIATHSSCCRKEVAALVIKNRRIVSTGINGSPSGQLECKDYFADYCKAHSIDNKIFKTRLNDKNDELYTLHHEFAEKFEIHSEQNAIAELSKNEINGIGADMVCTLSPCSNCAKLIVAAGIKRLFFIELYDRDTSGIDLCVNSGLEVYKVDLEKKEIERYIQH